MYIFHMLDNNVSNTHHYRATRWTTCWPLISVRCWPPWPSSAPVEATASELLTGWRPMSSFGSCVLLFSLQTVPQPAAMILAKAITTIVSANMIWTKTSHLVRMTTSDYIYKLSGKQVGLHGSIRSQVDLSVEKQYSGSKSNSIWLMKI